MKKMYTTMPALARRAAVALAVLGAASTLLAPPPALNSALFVRPLTPQEKTDYGLAALQGASGLNNVGLGQPAYLDALVNNVIAPTNIIQVTWAVTNRPLGSMVTNALASPLGTNVPVYRPSDAVSLQVAGRAMLRPDVAGQYAVVATIYTKFTETNGVVLYQTNKVAQWITGATYVGLNMCKLCHSGGEGAGEDTYHSWTNTGHATFFTRSIDGVDNDHYAGYCISCHTVGYDKNSLATNGGFDDMAAQLNWTFPTNLFAGTNWSGMDSRLKNLANIQCENCHGPGSEHAAALGQTNLLNWPRLGVTYGAGDCAQCHDSKPYHTRSAEWNNSRHAIATKSPSGPSRIACVRCHTAAGFKNYVEHLGSTNNYVTNTVYEAITCSACHDPHDASQPAQLRVGPLYTMPDGTTVNAGTGGVCLHCHHVRNSDGTNNVAKFQTGQATWLGGSSFGVHDSSQGDMLLGIGAITYGKDMPSGAHASITNLCVGCHMQPVASSDPAFTKAGGHTFSMIYSVVTNGVTNIHEKVDVCQQCHGHIESFDFVRRDYDGNGVIEGIQAEIQSLLDKLSAMLPPTNYYASPSLYQADGKVKTLNVRATPTNWPVKFLNAAFNWNFVSADGSKGIHNAPYAVGLLKASIADLSGDANTDGLPDWWQIAYFGSITNALGAPGATPVNDGVPNWLKYSLGINPMTVGIEAGDGIVWARGNTLVNPPGTNDALKVYTAAEIVYKTEVGKKYQLQAISSVGAGWQNVGPLITGTGEAMSFVTPTRYDLRQFYRVVITP